MVITVIHLNAAYPELCKYEHTQIVTFAANKNNGKIILFVSLNDEK